MNKKTYIIRFSLLGIAVIGVIAYFMVFKPILNQSEACSLYVDNDDSADSVYIHIQPITNSFQMIGIKIVGKVLRYDKYIRTGHYLISNEDNAISLIHKLRNGMQKPVKITIPNVRLMENLTAELGKRLMLDSLSLITLIRDSAVCAKYECDTATIACLFIPDTYEMYWNISPEKFLDKIYKEYCNYWTPTRVEKAKKAHLTPKEVFILASIIDEETAHNSEKPDVAAMYLNRLNKNMPLAADPTIKFVLRQFQFKRIYYSMLQTESPYNTYLHAGLPPGPIRIASKTSIEAVLNFRPNNYFYMCAKEDFSGSHNFARTFNEHQQNARRYYQALNKLNIK